MADMRIRRDERGGRGDLFRGLTNFAKSVQGSLVIRLTLPGFGLETCLHDILMASLVLPPTNVWPRFDNLRSPNGVVK